MLPMITAKSAKVCESFQLTVSLQLTNIHGMVAFRQTIQSQDSELWQLLIRPSGNSQSCDCCVLYTGPDDLRVQPKSYQIINDVDDATKGKTIYVGYDFPIKAGKPGDLSSSLAASFCMCNKWKSYYHGNDLNNLFLLPPNVTFEVVLTVHRQSHSKPQLMQSLDGEFEILQQIVAATCDVTLNVGDESFPQHKRMLSARSPVFKAMFESEMSESETSVVTIEDTDPDVFQLFLEYLYTDEYVASDDTLLGMFALTQKYSVPVLLDFCEQCLIDTLNLKNVVEILKFAQVYSTAVYNVAVKFIARNYKLLYQADPQFLASVGVDVKNDVLKAMGSL